MPNNHTSQKPFQLFSSKDIEELDFSQLDPEIGTNIKLLIFIFNGTMHHANAGWCSKLSAALQSVDEAALNKEEITNGIARYLEAAHRLQRPRQGEIRPFTFPSGRVIEREVNVYEAFFEDCSEALLHAF